MYKNFENRDGWIWYDGEFVEWNDAKSHVISQGLHYASAVFEGERAYNGKIFKSIEHTQRFLNLKQWELKFHILKMKLTKQKKN